MIRLVERCNAIECIKGFFLFIKSLYLTMLLHICICIVLALDTVQYMSKDRVILFLIDIQLLLDPKSKQFRVRTNYSAIQLQMRK